MTRPTNVLYDGDNLGVLLLVAADQHAESVAPDVDQAVVDALSGEAVR